MRTLYVVFDAENFQVGVMTNGLTLGWDHEDLLTVVAPKILISNKTLIITILAITFGSLLIALCLRYCHARRRRLALSKIK